jgi:hypothetical protein
MIAYVLSQAGRVLRETLALRSAPIPTTQCKGSDSVVVAAAPPRVSVNRIHYIVHLNGTVHRVRRDRVCDCGGTVRTPCPAVPLVQAYLAAGGPRPLGRHEDTWPETWATVPVQCPICDCPTIPDRYLNSRAGPGWRCSLTGCEHFWQVRMAPLRRYLATHSLEGRYPWYDTPAEERHAWLEAHSHPARAVPSLETMPPTRPKALPDPHLLAFPIPWPDPAAAQIEAKCLVHTST